MIALGMNQIARKKQPASDQGVPARRDAAAVERLSAVSFRARARPASAAVEEDSNILRKRSWLVMR